MQYFIISKMELLTQFPTSNNFIYEKYSIPQIQLFLL